MGKRSTAIDLADLPCYTTQQQVSPVSSTSPIQIDASSSVFDTPNSSPEGQYHPSNDSQSPRNATTTPTVAFKFPPGIYNLAVENNNNLRLLMGSDGSIMTIKAEPQQPAQRQLQLQADPSTTLQLTNNFWQTPLIKHEAPVIKQEPVSIKQEPILQQQLSPYQHDVSSFNSDVCLFKQEIKPELSDISDDEQVDVDSLPPLPEFPVIDNDVLNQYLDVDRDVGLTNCLSELNVYLNEPDNILDSMNMQSSRIFDTGFALEDSSPMTIQV